MIIFYDPLTLNPYHLVHNPVPIEYLATLEFGGNWISHEEDLQIGTFDLMGDPVEVVRKVEMPVDLEGNTLLGIPGGSILFYDDQVFDVSGDVELDLEPGTHEVLVRCKGYFDKRFEVTV